MTATWSIRAYTDADEVAWLRCRVLAFLDTAYFDSVERRKERYEHRSVELVAEAEGDIVGLIDVELEDRAGTVCSERAGLGGMIWHVAVHPDHRRRGIGEALVARAREAAAAAGVERFEAWTRDDPWVRRWYERLGFEQVDSYLHVYASLDDEVRDLFPVSGGLRPVQVYAHYVDSERDAVRERFARVHECVCYELRFW